MAVVIHGGGTIEGIAVGGLPDAIVDADMLASNAVTTAKIANSAVTAAKSSGLVDGITEVDQWRVHTDFAGWVSAAIVSSNWERCDNAPTLGKLGTGMSESSGIFTFPSTGIWQIYSDFSFNTNDEARYNGVNIYATTDNSSYAQITGNYGSSVHDASGLCYGHCHTTAIVDITDVSNQKVGMYLNSEAGNNTTWIGNSGKSENVTYFIRLGDT